MQSSKESTLKRNKIFFFPPILSLPKRYLVTLFIYKSILKHDWIKFQTKSIIKINVELIYSLFVDIQRIITEVL